MASKPPRSDPERPKARRPRSARGPGRSAEPAGAAAASLRDVLPRERWFGGKTRTIAGVEALDQVAISGTSGNLAIFEVAYVDGARERYVVPYLSGSAGAPFRDAMDDPAFCAALVEQIRVGASLPGLRGTFRFTATGVLEHLLPAPARDVVRVETEQSNTSVIYARAAILKLFRRLAPGPNPELEITDFLTRQTDFRGAPRLAGSFVYETGDDAMTLGVLQEFVENHGDAWTVLQARLVDYYAAAEGATRGGEPDPAFARALAAADAKEARRLGALTGDLHMALASAPPGSPLAPEPIDGRDLVAWRERMRSQLDRVMGRLTAALVELPPEVREGA
ncbi:MAG: maltokinase N-terminal cap-like domain-containing protein, partial [Candidatus Rokuibacteriota bacterium]